MGKMCAINTVLNFSTVCTILFLFIGFCKSNPPQQINLPSTVDLRSSNNFQLFSEVPSSFADTVRSLSLKYNDDLCKEHLQKIFDAVIGGSNDTWATEMIDSWGKIPSGILKGNFYELGSFEECLGVSKTFEDSTLTGKYCLAQVNVTGLEKIGLLSIGTCIPSSCNATVAQDYIESLLKLIKIPINNYIIPEDRCTIKEDKEFSALDWFAITLFSLFGLIMVVSTVYDYVVDDDNKKLPFIAFSIRENGWKLFKVQNETSSDVIGCLNGIRCLSIVWVVFGHSYMVAAAAPNVNPLVMLNMIKNYYTSVIHNATVSVDSFFLMSGLLVGWVFLKELNKRKGKVNILLMYFHRYLRLTPIVAMAILFTVTLYKYVGAGPKWNLFLTSIVPNCEKNWWSTLLYVQNYAHPKEMCLGHTWYLAVDTQLYILSPLIVIPLWKWGKKFIWVLPLLIIASMACTFTLFMTHDFSMKLLNTEQNPDRQPMTYYPTHTRYGPWLVGIILAYILHTIKGNKLKIPMILVLVGWISSIVTIFSILFAPYNAIQIETETTTLESAFYESFSRVSWSIALAWIVFACSQGYGGPVNSFLSLPIWQPFSRLSYSIYITHILVQYAIMGNLKIITHFSDFDVIVQFWGDFGISLCISIFTVLAFESPILQIEKMIFGKKKEAPDSKVIQPSHIENKHTV